MTRNGKIAHLPHGLREQLNQRLRDGEVGTRLLEWLNALPEVQTILQKEFCGRPILPQNLSDWKQGGFEDWVRHQESIVVTHRVLEESIELANLFPGHSLTEQVSVVAAMALGKSLREILREPTSTPQQRRELQSLTRELILLRRCGQEEERLNMATRDWEKKEEAAEKKQVLDNIHGNWYLRTLGEGVEKAFHRRMKKGPLTEEERKKYQKFFACTYGQDHPLTDSLRSAASPQTPDPIQPNQGESSQIKVDQGGSR